MTHTQQLKQDIYEGNYDDAFAVLYPQQPVEACQARYLDGVDRFEELFGPREAVLVSAPGRSEIGGNHTDHQHGRVLAAAVDLDILCVAGPNDRGVIRVHSEGYAPDEVVLDDLAPRAEERETAAALLRGIAAWFRREGYPIGGFDAYTTSNVLKGSGLSSSAAFEVAMGNILKALYGAAISPVDIARAGQYAENKYFGKPSGLMDQMASSVGGFVQIDFEWPDRPLIRPVPFDLAASGYHLCIVDTGGGHEDLTGEYAAVFEEMHAVAQCFGKEVLREVDLSEFARSIPVLRPKVGDRAVLRAMHFYNDNALALEMATALEHSDLACFLELSTRSGQSSFACLQNVFAPANPREQGLSLALALSEELLRGRGAWRVHGGGFAGTIQAFVPHELLDDYRACLDGVFGAGACHVLSVRPVGGIAVTERIEQGVR